MAAKTITATQFANATKSIANMPTISYAGKQCQGSTYYLNGKAGEKNGEVYLCDCRGLCIWALRLNGISFSCAGTNWMIRNQMTFVDKLTKTSQLRVGMVVLKSRDKSSSLYSLKDKYKKGGSSYKERFGELDVYHVGIVTQTSPSIVIKHCSNSGNKSGILTDTTINSWSWYGWLDKVTPDNGTVTLTLKEIQETALKINRMVTTAISGSTVNLRLEKSTRAKLLNRIPLGNEVIVLDRGSLWTKVKWRSLTGYIMTKYLKLIE